jgi:diaminopimelate epimerase
VVRSRTKIDIVTSEFGNGVTLACGTGSTATAFIAWATGKTEREMEVGVKGGLLEITVKKHESGETLLMKGPAKFVYVGRL